MAKKVLVIDDSRTIRLLVGEVLREAGYETAEAADGLEGAEKIQSMRDLALVLCDVNMPRMTGLEMLKLVKLHPDNRNLPVVMLTTEGQVSMIEKARAAGARGWIVKPVNADRLLATVRQLAGNA